MGARIDDDKTIPRNKPKAKMRIKSQKLSLTRRQARVNFYSAYYSAQPLLHGVGSNPKPINHKRNPMHNSGVSRIMRHLRMNSHPELPE
jgi:hypothetical protein